jgi:hypothetical protein
MRKGSEVYCLHGGHLTRTPSPAGYTDYTDGKRSYPCNPQGMESVPASLTTDANGNPVAQANYALYDGYGGVLTSTLPATLTAQGVITDPDTGLVYLGEGRFL